MKKCYIAGKIGDMPLEVYQPLFKTAKVEVVLMGFIPVSPIELPHDHDKTWISYMKEDIRAITECDAVYCLNNWRHSLGATIEIDIAVKLGLQIIQQPFKY